MSFIGNKFGHPYNPNYDITILSKNGGFLFVTWNSNNFRKYTDPDLKNFLPGTKWFNTFKVFIDTDTLMDLRQAIENQKIFKNLLLD